MKKNRSFYKTITLLSLILTVLTVGTAFSGYATKIQSQSLLETKVTIAFNGENLQHTIDKLAAASKIKFAYDAKQLPAVGFKAPQKTFTETRLGNVLSTLFSAGSIGYRELSNNILLYEKKEKITGKITDEKGLALPGVIIKLKHSGAVTSTNSEGLFSITGPSDDVLVISFIGYKTKEVAINGRVAINESLIPENSQLSEIVVIGYQTTTKRSVSTSISSVNAKDIEPYSTGNVANALQGKIAGVQVLPGNGLPGSQPTILIRGLSSLTGNTTPLIIVDGNEIGYNGLNFINPSDIESIDVLKDAAAAAIYGSRSGQGVVLITTKRGKGRPIISFESSVGMDKLPKVNVADANEFTTIMNRVAANSGIQPYFNTSAPIDNTDYWKQTFDNGSRQNYNLSATGSTDKLSFFGSLGYYDQNSYFASSKGGSYQKITARFNADMTISKVFKVGVNFSPRYEKWLGSPADNIKRALTMDPTTLPLKTSNDDVYKAIPVGFMDFTAFNPYYSLPNISLFNSVTNPEFYNRINFDKNDAFGAQFGTYLEAKPIKNLTLKTAVDGFGNVTTQQGYTPKYFLGANATGNNRESLVSATTAQNLRWKVTNTANYTFDLQQHHFDILAGQSMDNYTTKGTSTTKKDIPFDEEAYRYVASAPTVVSASGYYQPGATPFGKMLSFFGSLRYNYQSKYYIAGTMRADASSLVNPLYRWGYFPSISGAWIVSEEKFFKEIANTVNLLKLRASWGKSGGNLPTSVGAYLTTVSPQNYSDGNENVITGYLPNNIANPEIKWEIQQDYTLGFDAALFNNKLNLTVETFVRKPENLLVNVNVDPALGYPQDYLPAQPTNIGKLTTKGWDIALGYKTNITDDLHLGIDLTVSHYKSMVGSLGSADPIRYGQNNDVISTFRSRLTKGHEPGAWYGYRVDGVFQSDAEASAYKNSKGETLQPLAKAGDLKFADVNKDGLIDNNDLTDIGSPWPKLTTGLTLTLGWKGLDFRTEFYGAYDYEYNNTYRLSMTPTGHLNFMSGMGDQFWHGPGTSNTFPILRFPDANGNFSKMSTFMLEDASFTRCRLIQIGYTVPETLIKGVKNFRIYVSAQNPFILTKYSGLNPDLPFQGIGLNGIDEFQAPQPKTFLIGLQLRL